jgi:hypothetical protein
MDDVIRGYEWHRLAMPLQEALDKGYVVVQRAGEPNAYLVLCELVDTDTEDGGFRVGTSRPCKVEDIPEVTNRRWHEQE